MLIANITDKAKMVAAEGNLLTLTADVCLIIAGVYQKLDDKRGGNMMRELFRKSLINFLTNEDSLLFIPIEEMEKKSGEVSEK